jgi:hypothetical protein
MDTITAEFSEVANGNSNPAALIKVAVDKGAPIEYLDRLLNLQLKWEANEARKAFTRAMSEFKSDPPSIIKDRQVSFNQTHYKHASLGNVVRETTAALGKHGLSARWVTTQAEGGKSVTVSCVVTHLLGHSEEVSLTAPMDTSGSKNPIQAICSTVSYLQRYTLLAALGLATEDQDDDIATAAPPPPSEAPKPAAPQVSIKNQKLLSGLKKYGIDPTDIKRIIPRDPQDWTDEDYNLLVKNGGEIKNSKPEERAEKIRTLFKIADRDPGEEG